MFSFQRQNKRTSKGSQKNVFKEGKNDNKITYNLMLNSFVDECVQGNENKKVDMKKRKKVNICSWKNMSFGIQGMIH